MHERNLRPKSHNAPCERDFLPALTESSLAETLAVRLVVFVEFQVCLEPGVCQHKVQTRSSTSSVESCTRTVIGRVMKYQLRGVGIYVEGGMCGHHLCVNLL